MRGRLKTVILELLQEYHRVEDAFQGEARVGSRLSQRSSKEAV